MQNNIIITLFILQISIGNLARILPLPIKFGNISLIEILLYLSVIIYAVIQKKIIEFISQYYMCLFLLLLSGIIGVARVGFDVKSISYLIRLILILLSGYCICHALYGKFLHKMEKVFYVIVCGYFVNIVLGYVIYFIFPDSIELWMALSLMGIEFKGDPHQSRFVSTYLDPNFFAVIACIPLIMSFYLLRRNYHKKFSVIMIVLLIITEFCTLSRSGIATFIITGLILLREDIYLFVHKMKLRKSIFGYCIWGAIITAVLCILNWDTAVRLMERFHDMERDPSALHRADSFQEGLDVLSEYMILGIGYNFSDTFELSIDSSVLLLTVCFGVLIFSVFVIIFFVYSWNIICRNDEIEKSYWYYLLIVIFFSSFFNQLLTYPYWLLPYITITLYLNKIQCDESYMQEKIKNGE